MNNVTFSVDDMASALHALLPPGAAWPRDPSTVQHQVVRGLAASFARLTGRAGDLLTDANPATSYELLPEWEDTLGLPGVCGGAGQGTIQDRQRAAVTALTDQGGQGVGDLVNVARSLGYDISITEFTPFTVMGSVTDGWTGDTWAHVWQVNGAAYRVTLLDVNSDVNAGLAVADSFLLGCVLNRIKPAHTTVIFNNT